MNISSFATKASLVKGAATLSGLSTASVGGYYTYDWMRPATKFKDLSLSGIFTPSKHECFTTLSFSAELPTSIDFAKKTTFSNSTHNPESPTTTTSEGSTQGCTVMKKTDHGSRGWEFESGTLIKNDKNGIFVSFELNSKNEGNSRFQAYFFEKKSENWEIKFGFISEWGVTNVSSITTPDGSSIKASYDATSKAVTYEGTSESYSKKWEESGEDGAESLLFDGVFKNLQAELPVSYVYKNATTLYKREGDAISLCKTALTKWFNLFKDKKGKWN